MAKKEAFAAPTALRDLPSEAFVSSSSKLRGATNLFDMLTSRRQRTQGASKLPVVVASSTVGILGAARLAPYVAGVRAIEALCDRTSASVPLDTRCVALSAWAEVGITEAFPVLSRASPAAGFHVLSRSAGLLCDGLIHETCLKERADD